ncbi:hypothetical protein PO909_002821 [Leuciscus waleckii]
MNPTSHLFSRPIPSLPPPLLADYGCIYHHSTPGLTVAGMHNAMRSGFHCTCCLLFLHCSISSVCTPQGPGGGIDTPFPPHPSHSLHPSPVSPAGLSARPRMGRCSSSSPQTGKGLWVDAPSQDERWSLIILLGSAAMCSVWAGLRRIAKQGPWMPASEFSVLLFYFSSPLCEYLWPLPGSLARNPMSYRCEVEIHMLQRAQLDVRRVEWGRGILAKNHSQAGPLPPWVLTATSQPWPAADGTKNNIRQRKGSNYDCLEIGIHILNYYQPDSKINTQSQPEIGQSLPGLGRVAKEMEIINRMKWNRATDYITANECTSKGSLYVI